ncbi:MULTISPECIES: M20 family metallo-hydrolase [Edwardsiella]|uniref:N-acyl-L-amino acid amidohydrolase n=2 Tax=Edwardsiella anguillarum TaxID=1821960 RepID=A0A076LW81_9GAMM|nr:MULTISPECIES: M20 family metallo-hydrolase [Edwardsiella]AIJ09749.1 N-acyl-L-amino acid amidohydrolase [Edwardsiella anguillarum ET080813]AKR77458.1 M20 family metallo-hydrolase [Edwardsiella sp. LADL05-105]KAB0592750.1 amidohydrolase [Edwardsiella anguillarum]UOU80508.1 M20 family metallo-hydrolase [Edwardsiella anguillarum]WHP85766.1 M20 family metallo-hydrolase [Edwardsiella anguillarum]
MTVSDQEQLRRWRRMFHQIPETGWSEFITSARLIEILRAIGYRVLPGSAFLSREHIQGRNDEEVAQGLARARRYPVSDALLEEMGDLTGCVALLETGRPGPTVALRFDIDCVAVTESDAPQHPPRAADFASRHPGCMHACGHDGHMAIGLGVAQALCALRDRLCGTVKLLFQPAEEGVRGAKPVAEGGLLDDVDYFLSAHIGMGVPSGEIVVDPRDFLCTTKLDLRFFGAPAHAGMMPQGGANALAGACHCVTQLLGIPRHGDGMSRINVGTLRAGEGRNVIPAYAEMQLEVRGANRTINDYMAQQALRIADGAAQSFGLRVEHQVMGSAVDLHNDAALMTLVADIASQQLDLRIGEASFGGSEDATLLVERVQAHGGQAAYVVLGADLRAGHHQSEFDFDDAVLSRGCALFTACVSRLCRTAQSA